MRLRSLSASALAAAALFSSHGVVATPAPPVPVLERDAYAFAPSIAANDMVQGAPSSASSPDTTTHMTTYTIYRTVERVVATATATGTPPADATTVAAQMDQLEASTSVAAVTMSTVSTPASASITVTPYVNGTTSVLGTGAKPTASATPQSGAAARSLPVDVAGLVAVVGMAGLLVA
jgi:hypothetical protein